MVEPVQVFDGDGRHYEQQEIDEIHGLLSTVVNAKNRDKADGNCVRSFNAHLYHVMVELGKCRPRITEQAVDALTTVEIYLRHYGLRVFEGADQTLFRVQQAVRVAVIAAERGYRKT